MTDKDSKNAGKHEIENPLFEEHIDKEPANEGVKLDQLQDDFNSLIADSKATCSEAPYAQNPTPQTSAPQISDHLDAESQHSTTQTAEFNIPKQQDKNPYEEATDAFNDLADAFTLDAAPTSRSDNNDAYFSSHLDQSFNEFESSSVHQNVSSEAQNSDLATEQHLANDKFPAFESDEYTPTSSFPVSGGSILNQGSGSSLENSSAIHADLSGGTGSVTNMPIMALAAATVLVIAGAGIYWYSMGSTGKPVQVVQGEQIEIPERATLSSTNLTEERMPADKLEPLDQNGTITGSSESNSFAQAETAIPASLSTEDAIKLITQKRARNAAQRSDGMDEIETVSNTTPPETQPQNVAPMQTSTPISTPTSSLAATTSYDRGSWVIVAPVVSKPSALRYVASFKAKGIESEVLQRTSKSLDKYFVRLLGFNSQQDAEKRIKRLSMLGLRNAKVLNAANSWEGNRVAMQAVAPSTAPTAIPQQGAALAYQAPETAETEFAQQAPTVSVKAKTAPKTSKKQPIQLVSEFDLNDEPVAEVDAIQQTSEIDVQPTQSATLKASFKRVGRADTQLLEQVSDIDVMPVNIPISPIKMQTPRSTHPSIDAPLSTFKQPAALSSDPLIRANEIYNLSRSTTPSRNSVNRPKSFTRTVKSAPVSINSSRTQAYQRPVNTSPLDTQKRWTIVALVNDSETAKEYVDRFHAKYMESEAVELNVNGEIRHFVYIKGFTNQLSAQKRRDRLVNQSVLESTATVEEL